MTTISMTRGEPAEAGLDRRRRPLDPLGAREGARARGHSRSQSFASAYEVAAGAAARASRRCWCPTSACPANPASRCSTSVKERHPAAAGDHHDRVFGPRQRGRGVPGRRVRIPAQAVRRRSRGRADPPRERRGPGDGGAGAARRRRRRDARPGAGDAGSLSRDRPPVAIARRRC